MEKKNYTSAFIKPIIQAWLSSLDCTRDSSDYNRLFIEEPQNEFDERGFQLVRFGIMQFYDKSVKKREQGSFYGDILELSIYEEYVDFENKDKEPSLTGYLIKIHAQPIYYLHFEMIDFEFVLEQLASFFKFLYKTEEEDIEMKVFPSNIQSILICCTVGLTSGYFANLLQDKMDQDKKDNTIKVRGASVNRLPDIINEYDIVLLSPQVYYLEEELKEKYGDKIQKIDRVDFATFDFNSLLEKLYHSLK